MFACTLFGIDRQVYYRKIKRSIIKQDKASLVVEMVLEIRRQMPRIGSKKLYYLLNKDLQTLKVGRDKFIDIHLFQFFFPLFAFVFIFRFG